VNLYTRYVIILLAFLLLRSASIEKRGRGTLTRKANGFLVPRIIMSYHLF